MSFPTGRAIGIVPPLIDRYELVLRVVPLLTTRSYREPTTIAERLLNVMITFVTAHAIRMKPPLVDHGIRFRMFLHATWKLSGGWVGKKTNSDESIAKRQ